MVVVQSVEEYFESRRKVIDKYVEGEHKWYGDLSTDVLPLSMYSTPLPWYLKSTSTDKIECKGNN